MVYRFIVILGGLVLFLAFVSPAIQVGPVPTAIANSESSNGAGVPVRITIPKINVDATIEPVGLTGDGAMDAPKGPAETGWFSFGARPGEVGSAVIAGHSGWKNNIPAAFDELNKLRVGDSISVVDDNGAIITFIVRKVQTYDPNADASDVFSSSDGKAHLNLITCEGAWDKLSKSFPKRFIVFSDKE